MSTPTPTTLPPLQGRYRIEDRLGASRLAVVYRAYDDRLQRPVLVHLLRREHASQPALRERFLQEAQHGAGRSHRSLLDVYDTGDLAGRPFLITEYVAGRPLRELGALSLEDALLYFRQVVGAVAACQSIGVPHPPISSSNIILVDDGHVELLESWLLTPEQVPRDLACYRPPERASGAPLTPAGAVYSLGLLLVELISGKRPIDGTDAVAVAQSHHHITIPAINQLQPKIYAPALDRLIQQMTSRDPQQRLPDAMTLAGALDQLHQELTSDTRRLAVAPPPSMRERVMSETNRLMQTAQPAVRRRLPPTTGVPAGAPVVAEPVVVSAPPRGRAALGLAIIAVLFLVVACVAYNLASVAVERLADIQLPRLDLAIPGLGGDLPTWLTGEVEGPGITLEISIPDSEGLNIREAPGLTTPVLTLLPNGTRVKRIDGPRVVDGVPWMRVRAQINGRTIDGWVSANYVRQV